MSQSDLPKNSLPKNGPAKSAESIVQRYDPRQPVTLPVRAPVQPAAQPAAIPQDMPAQPSADQAVAPAASPAAGRAGENRPPEKRPVEIGGPTGPEPTRYGDWERNGRVSDF